MIVKTNNTGKAALGQFTKNKEAAGSCLGSQQCCLCHCGNGRL